MFLGKTLDSHGASRSPPRCINGYRRNAGGNPAMDSVASHPEGSRNTPSRFILRKLEISAGLMGLLARKQ